MAIDKIRVENEQLDLNVHIRNIFGDFDHLYRVTKAALDESEEILYALDPPIEEFERQAEVIHPDQITQTSEDLNNLLGKADDLMQNSQEREEFMVEFQSRYQAIGGLKERGDVIYEKLATVLFYLRQFVVLRLKIDNDLKMTQDGIETTKNQPSGEDKEDVLKVKAGHQTIFFITELLRNRNRI